MLSESEFPAGALSARGSLSIVAEALRLPCHIVMVLAGPDYVCGKVGACWHGPCRSTQDKAGTDTCPAPQQMQLDASRQHPEP